MSVSTLYVRSRLAGLVPRDTWSSEPLSRGVLWSESTEYSSGIASNCCVRPLESRLSNGIPACSPVVCLSRPSRLREFFRKQQEKQKDIGVCWRRFRAFRYRTTITVTTTRRTPTTNRDRISQRNVSFNWDLNLDAFGYRCFGLCGRWLPFGGLGLPGPGARQMGCSRWPGGIRCGVTLTITGLITSSFPAPSVTETGTVGTTVREKGAFLPSRGPPGRPVGLILLAGPLATLPSSVGGRGVLSVPTETFWTWSIPAFETCPEDGLSVEMVSWGGSWSGGSVGIGCFVEIPPGTFRLVSRVVKGVGPVTGIDWCPVEFVVELAFMCPESSEMGDTPFKTKNHIQVDRIILSEQT